MELEKIKKEVQKILSEKRYYHSLCVMERCEELAIHFGISVEMAKKVGIAHDVAKEMSNVEKLKYIEENQISIDEVERENTGLLHAKIGADIAKKKFGFSEQMVKAIESHTTGKENMDLLAKILYLADATGKDRKWNDVEFVKELTIKNIDKAILYMYDMTIKENIEKGKQIHLDTVKARNEILSLKNVK